jgi:methionine synthase I (cobalamin-dependent)
MPMKGLIEELGAGGPVVTDGAWGTELQARGLGASAPGDFWNLSHPDRVEEVARAYVDAGSQVILTNTFRANRIALAQFPGGEEVTAINRAGVEISRRAAAGRARVFASIGPSGKLLMMKQIDEEGLRVAFTEQARAQAEAGADAIVIETMTDLTEAGLALEAAKATGLPVVVCMVFDSGKNKDRTMMGVSPEQAADELTRLGADAVGANCGVGIEQYIPVCASLAAATELPVWIKPNAGLPQIVGTEVVYPTTPQQFAGQLPELLAAGARFVGGCCGSNPEFITALRERLAS